VRAGGIFEDEQMVFLRNRHNCVHVRRLADDMDRNDGVGARGDGGFESGWVKVKGFEVNVGEDRNQIGLKHCGRCGQKSV